MTTKEELEKAVKEEKKVRADACKAEIDALLKTYNCVLVPVVQIAGGEIMTDVIIAAQ
jgi:hypothetical protein